jgi:hypothetical protein
VRLFCCHIEQENITITKEGLIFLYPSSLISPCTTDSGAEGSLPFANPWYSASANIPVEPNIPLLKIIPAATFLKRHSILLMI